MYGCDGVNGWLGIIESYKIHAKFLLMFETIDAVQHPVSIVQISLC